METKFKLGNKELVITHDSQPENPRVWDNLTQILLFGKHKSWGDNHDIKLGEYSSRQDFIDGGAEDIKRHFRRNGQTVLFIRAIHVYEHSGTAISLNYEGQFTCRFDSGTIGFIVITKEDLRENFYIKRITEKYKDKAWKILLGEFKTFSQFISGEVYQFELKNGIEVVDSVCGFFGRNWIENGILDYVGVEWKEVLNE